MSDLYKDRWTTVVTLSSGVDKTFTDFNFEAAKEFAARISKDGLFQPNSEDGGGVFYPPHRIQSVTIQRQKESDKEML